MAHGKHSGSVKRQSIRSLPVLDMDSLSLMPWLLQPQDEVMTWLPAHILNHLPLDEPEG